MFSMFLGWSPMGPPPYTQTALSQAGTATPASSTALTSCSWGWRPGPWGQSRGRPPGCHPGSWGQRRLRREGGKRENSQSVAEQSVRALNVLLSAAAAVLLLCCCRYCMPRVAAKHASHGASSAARCSPLNARTREPEVTLGAHNHLQDHQESSNAQSDTSCQLCTSCLAGIKGNMSKSAGRMRQWRPGIGAAAELTARRLLLLLRVLATCEEQSRAAQRGISGNASLTPASHRLKRVGALPALAGPCCRPAPRSAIEAAHGAPGCLFASPGEPQAHHASASNSAARREGGGHGCESLRGLGVAGQGGGTGCRAGRGRDS